MKVLQVVGYKNAARRRWFCELVRMLSAEGLRVATLKRDAHQVEPEPEGADTRLHREAGAFLSGMTSAGRTSWIREQPAELDEMLFAAEQAGADFVIVEGFKTAPHPKIVMLRNAHDTDLLQLSRIVAVAIRGLQSDNRQPRTAISPPPPLNIPCFTRMIANLGHWFILCAIGLILIRHFYPPNTKRPYRSPPSPV